MRVLADALGGMRDIPQWFIWRLEWQATEGKYKKTPWASCPIDASLPSAWLSYTQAVSTLTALNADPSCATGIIRYGLGFWLTANSGYWFFDLDKCAIGDKVLSDFAAGMVAAFPGALMEWSSSGKGIHIIGKYAAPIGPHRSRDVHKLNLEFYTQGRGIAFGLDGIAQGSADSCHDVMVAQLIEQYFPARAVAESVGARAEWRGPSDDDELVRRMLAARVSAESAFGGKPNVRQLWNGECEKDSGADMALASHLAFWTGCDAERMERLMRRSGLVRPKWNEHRTYLRELTITNAIAGCSTVYQEPQRNLTVATGLYESPLNITNVVGDVITPEVSARVKELLAMVSACGNIEDMHNQCVPAIRGAGVPAVYQEQLVRSVNNKLDFFDSKLPVGKVRALLFPPVIAGSDAPEWMMQHCYCLDGDFFYNVTNGARMTQMGFIAEHARLMPLKENGARENPVSWAFDRYGIVTVHRLGYRPDQPTYFEWDGLTYANLYNPASVPKVASEYTPAGIAGIDALQKMLFDMCGRRPEVFSQLLSWLAHNVQKPGVKIRWSPLLKGTQGDGKSLLSAALRAVMGYRNLGVTGNSTLTASGGFNDWAVGYAVNVLEEVQLTGKERYRWYNAMKEFISNDVVNINAKGGKTYQTFNTTNHLGNTNHNDGMPLEKEDRRWFVIFTPWSTLKDMKAYCGLDDAGWQARTDAIDHAWRECAGELRKWFLGLPIASDFKANGSAPLTPERLKMMASSQDDAESVAQSIIMEGGHGITENVISSPCLTNALKLRAIHEGFEVPRSIALNHMLTRLGYSKLPKQIKWRQSVHTIWVKNGFTEDNEVVRSELDKPST